jgi:tripeptidyl-peptidase-1
VSANGVNYVIAIDGNFSYVYGTSASTPTFGSVLTLVNAARFDVGKSSIGFINPVLYANPNILNDITSGGNQGCGRFFLPIPTCFHSSEEKFLLLLGHHYTP